LRHTTRNAATAAPPIDHLRRLSPGKCSAEDGQRSGARSAACRRSRRIRLSGAVDTEIAGVLGRPRFALTIPLARRERVLEILRRAAVWFEPAVRVTDCRDPKDDKYLELALAAGAEIIVSGDDDLLVLHPWRGVRILRPADYLTLA
jgi:uncharacterized protein